MRPPLIILSILLFFVCSCEIKKDVDTHSLTILYENSDDPLDPCIFGYYQSRYICSFGFELKNNQIKLYKHTEEGRFAAEKTLSADSATIFKSLVEEVYSYKSHSFYKDSTISLSTSTNCGATYVPIITRNNSNQANIVRKSFKKRQTRLLLSSLEYSAFADTVFSRLNWKKLKNNDFPQFVLFAEQFANLNSYLPPPPPYRGPMFSPPKVQK